jgi:signal transduction histidine kinase
MNRRKLNHVLLQAAERESRRMAEELHDTLCQSLAGISLLVKRVQRRIENGRPVDPADLGRIAAHLDEAIDSVRAPIHLEALLAETNGLARVLEELCRAAGRKVPCRFESRGNLQTLRAPVHVFYRVAREVLGNLLRHKSTREIAVSLEEKNGIMTMNIRGVSESAPTLPDADLLRRYADAVGIQLSISRAPTGALYVRCVYPEKKIRPPTASGRSRGKILKRAG